MIKKTAAERTQEALLEIERKYTLLNRRIEEKQKLFISEMTRALELMEEAVQRSEFNTQKCQEKIESFEDGLLHVMHNIKKNQFIYAHYPEEWVENYLSIKEGIKFENEYMEKRGAI